MIEPAPSKDRLLLTGKIWDHNCVIRGEGTTSDDRCEHGKRKTGTGLHFDVSDRNAVSGEGKQKYALVGNGHLT